MLKLNFVRVMTIVIVIMVAVGVMAIRTKAEAPSANPTMSFSAVLTHAAFTPPAMTATPEPETCVISAPGLHIPMYASLNPGTLPIAYIDGDTIIYVELLSRDYGAWALIRTYHQELVGYIPTMFCRVP